MERKGIVIGGGASGLTAAIWAARSGASVTVLEHMLRVGKKILSTGNGKCNMTNLRMSADCYRCGTPGFPMKVIERFPVSETLRFFRSMGVMTTERNGYVYPASGQAQTVLDALRGEAESRGVRTVCDCTVVSAEYSGPSSDGSDGFTAHTSAGDFSADFLILAAGSMAAPSTGSDGSGYGLAKSFGHGIKKPLPALVQLRCEGDHFGALAGIRTEAKIALYAGKKSGDVLLAEDRGELQLTAYGLSGIPAFQVSRYAAEALDKKERVYASVDFFPSLDTEGLISELKEQRGFLACRDSETFLDGFFHKRLAAFFLKQAGIDKKRQISAIPDRKLERLAEEIKEQIFPVSGVNSFDAAQVCSGGVRTSEIDAGTMGSLLVPGLYFAGEIVDVDGICGGYNLQWAWSSGYLAGVSAARGRDWTARIQDMTG